ncbi:hypothetical protein BCR32DRAFT_251367 [Anaeromyces robustus]|uniref:Phage tail lysozyme domain-containing protein n=1 Tax=Anaeromyces robustus TaxID=1754192 RepID=A0A1Y1VRN1_9FUNG|nr:hypothetical protein BCR32DRAFT_251367 [Anaeromyces robustus]|eukprot:ORX63940.1 hypothetical protein BCR32DRAFT_251367 [Anaeromyces robustus]
MCCPREGSNSNPVKPDDTICLSLGGQCKNQNSCKGTIHSGICSGGNDRKCCLPSGTSCQSVGGVCNVLNKRYDILKTLFLDKLCPGNNKCCISLTGPLSCQDQHGVKGVCINEKNCDKEYNTIYQNYALSELPCPVPSVCCVPKPKEDSIIINLQKNYNGTKKEAIIAAAREMLNNDYDKKFIAGVLGNIESEAKTGQFEDACYKKDGVCTSEILSERIPCYLRCMVDNFDYFDKYSNKIITEVGIDQTMKLLNNANECKNCKLKGTCDIGTKNEKHAGDSCSPKFGLGAVQWTPPNGVMKDYSEFRKTSGKNKPTVGECAIVEAIFLVKDLGSKNIYENWKKGERSPESAAYDVCMNYEKPRNMKEECPKRKGNASNIYKLM